SLQRLGDLSADAQSLSRLERRLAQPFGKRGTRHQLENQKVNAARLLESVDRRDVGMIQGSQQPRLALEPCQPLRIARKGLRQNLDRHVASEHGIGGAVHLPHAALAQFRFNPVMAQSLTDHDCWNLWYTMPKSGIRNSVREGPRLDSGETEQRTPVIPGR